MRRSLTREMTRNPMMVAEIAATMTIVLISSVFITRSGFDMLNAESGCAGPLALDWNGSGLPALAGTINGSAPSGCSELYVVRPCDMGFGLRRRTADHERR